MNKFYIGYKNINPSIDKAVDKLVIVVLAIIIIMFFIAGTIDFKALGY